MHGLKLILAWIVLLAVSWAIGAGIALATIGLLTAIGLPLPMALVVLFAMACGAGTYLVLSAMREDDS